MAQPLRRLPPRPVVRPRRLQMGVGRGLHNSEVTVAAELVEEGAEIRIGGVAHGGESLSP
jgi:hypothetical protein